MQSCQNTCCLESPLQFLFWLISFMVRILQQRFWLTKKRNYNGDYRQDVRSSGSRLYKQSRLQGFRSCMACMWVVVKIMDHNFDNYPCLYASGCRLSQACRVAGFEGITCSPTPCKLVTKNYIRLILRGATLTHTRSDVRLYATLFPILPSWPGSPESPT